MENKSPTEATTMKFFYNGIKGLDGKLQKCHYGKGPWINQPEDMIKIYKSDYLNFSKEVHEAFEVFNGSDLMTDYFEKDSIRVYVTHPLYQQVKEALAKQQTHRDIRANRYLAKVA